MDYFSYKNISEDNFSNAKKTYEEKKIILDFIHNISYDIITQLTEFKFPTLNLKCKSEQTLIRCLNFSSSSNTHKLALYIKLLSIIHRLIIQDQYATKRDLLYQYKHVFKNQALMDNLINDLARTLNVSRSSFNIKATLKGIIAGEVGITMLDGTHQLINDLKQGISIPDNLDIIKDIQTKAKFVLIVEKDATLQRLLDDNFLFKYPALLITGKGEPDFTTRKFVNLLFKKFGTTMEFFCLTDANPYGLLICSTYKYGSKALSFDKDLNLPCLKWLERNKYLLELNQRDKKIAENLIEKFQELHEFSLIKESNHFKSLNSCLRRTAKPRFSIYSTFILHLFVTFISSKILSSLVNPFFLFRIWSSE
ncbi:meiotic recombination SPO11 isoform X1 [Brachionus plicatilis]|uniref:DNA topoisomerase (ATP-hydrolyzing) n=1 Tax=Brachionus plicatilis TaxID=10195 RepID=A0A3M7QAJ9_BRAPC|nr:meiotic recombination SPO11 isoform X1 [Brachionus plicatilis]